MPYEGPIISRDAAKAAGLTRYFTGKPCVRGHLSQRRTVNHVCTECEWKKRCREQRNAAQRAAYKPEKARAWYLRDQEKVKARSKSNYWANPEAAKARVKARRLAEPDKVRLSQQAWYRANTALVIQRVQEWNAANPEAARSRGRNYRARSKNAEGSHTGDDIKALFIKQRGQCVYCGVKLSKGYHVDHIMPLALGGTNWPSNLQLTCEKCNNRKRATDPVEYARRIGLLI